MNKFIVTTTINAPTEALKRFDAMEDWHLIVIGDLKTPEFSLKNGDYISTEKQKTLGFTCVSHIPWNVIQRRNIGYLLAIREGADIIATVDDDNIPYDNWGKNLRIGKVIKTRKLSAELVCDSLYEHSNVTSSKLWHRGYPVQRLEERRLRKEHIGSGRVEVQAELWDGDPDVDAVCRLAGGPFDLKFSDTEFLIEKYTFSPYNTQNTFFSRQVAPCMCLGYDIGRMDDIWASYMTQRVMWEFGGHLLFTGPTVYQDRNVHDLSKDLENELIGYRNTDNFLKRLSELRLEGTSPLELYASLVEKIKECMYISENMTNFQRAWISDVEKIL